MIRITLVFLVCWLCSDVVWAQDFEPLDTGEDSHRLNASFDFGIGAGGFFSSGAQNPALMAAVGGGYRLMDIWRIGVAYDIKMQPWEESRSIFQSFGPDLRISLWRELYLEAGIGVAWAFLKKGVYQQSRTGMGWRVRVGYAYMPHRNIGLNVALALCQRYFSRLYTDFGALVGPEIRF